MFLGSALGREGVHVNQLTVVVQAHQSTIHLVLGPNCTVTPPMYRAGNIYGELKSCSSFFSSLTTLDVNVLGNEHIV